MTLRAGGWHGTLAAGVLFLLTSIALTAPWLSAYSPTEQDLLNTFAPPLWADHGTEHLLGTDGLGRDVMARLVYGTRAALWVALLSATLTAALGTLLGLLAGYHDGWPDRIVSRLVDVWTSFPPVLMCIVLAALLGAGLHTVIIALVIIDWTRFCRVVRMEVKRLRELDYVTASVALGRTTGQILWRTLLPNLRPLLLTLFTLEMGIAVNVEAVLAFVGLSATTVPTWGNILQEGRAHLYQAWWLMALPLGCIILTTLAFNSIGSATGFSAASRRR